MSFPHIATIDDIAPHVAGKKEIKFQRHPNGCTVGCYVFCDSKTFDSAEARECRGIAFDSRGDIVSRPLHKFFNIGERPDTQLRDLMDRDDLVSISEKIDGSMIATAWVDGELLWRSKKSFDASIVGLCEPLVTFYLREFATQIASHGLTAVFELTHPEARIVCAEPAALRLLHVRDNYTGEYVLLDADHWVHGVIAAYEVPVAQAFDLTFGEAIEQLELMRDREGFVFQFANGDMVKGKCPWYRRLHKSVTFLRERSIAELALNEELDDVKGALAEIGVDLAAVLEVESRLKGILLGISDEVDAVYEPDKALDRKSFAIKHREHPYFGMLMCRYIGRDIGLNDWYRKHRLAEDFGLRVLANEAQLNEVLAA